MTAPTAWSLDVARLSEAEAALPFPAVGAKRGFTDLLRRARRAGASGRTMLVLATLWSFSNREGIAWPSLKMLVAWTGMSESGVRRALVQLRGLGLISEKKLAGGGAQ